MKLIISLVVAGLAMVFLQFIHTWPKDAYLLEIIVATLFYGLAMFLMMMGILFVLDLIISFYVVVFMNGN